MQDELRFPPSSTSVMLPHNFYRRLYNRSRFDPRSDFSLCTFLYPGLLFLTFLSLNRRLDSDVVVPFSLNISNYRVSPHPMTMSSTLLLCLDCRPPLLAYTFLFASRFSEYLSVYTTPVLEEAIGRHSCPYFCIPSNNGSRYIQHHSSIVYKL